MSTLSMDTGRERMEEEQVTGRTGCHGIARNNEGRAGCLNSPGIHQRVSLNVWAKSSAFQTPPSGYPRHGKSSTDSARASKIKEEKTEGIVNVIADSGCAHSIHVDIAEDPLLTHSSWFFCTIYLL